MTDRSSASPKPATKKTKAANSTLNWTFTDTSEQHVLELANAALSHIAGRQAADADATFCLTREKLNDILLGETSFEKEVAGGSISVTGDAGALGELLSMLDTFDFWFNIVTPVDPLPS